MLACLLSAVISSTNENHAELLNLDVITGEAASSMMITDNRLLWLHMWADEQYMHASASQWVQGRISAVAAILARVSWWNSESSVTGALRSTEFISREDLWPRGETETADETENIFIITTLRLQQHVDSNVPVWLCILTLSLISVILHSLLHYFCLCGNGFSFGFFDR